ncbi:MAG: YihA family ribosome biogenesis GTP-binding protein [Clostridiaceae bacterium]|nr:YihA family ribosome biogenesis GTP-binding protein [Clostridiaceae bacterium]
MNIKWSEHLTTAVSPDGYPLSELPEIAMVGRSNVGKSSLINLLTGRKSLARVGNTPGKTRVINFYNVEDKLILVDLPGYGYAKVSEAEKNRWGKIIETYLNTRKQLSAMIMLTDIRHKPTQQDIVMYQWICSMGKPHVIVATKADKIAKAHYDKHIAQIRLTLGLVPEIPVIPISSTKRLGLINVWNEIEKVVPGLEIVPDK